MNSVLDFTVLSNTDFTASFVVGTKGIDQSTILTGDTSKSWKYDSEDDQCAHPFYPRILRYRFFPYFSNAKANFDDIVKRVNNMENDSFPAYLGHYKYENSQYMGFAVKAAQSDDQPVIIHDNDVKLVIKSEMFSVKYHESLSMRVFRTRKHMVFKKGDILLIFIKCTDNLPAQHCYFNNTQQSVVPVKVDGRSNEYSLVNIGIQYVDSCMTSELADNNRHTKTAKCSLRQNFGTTNCQFSSYDCSVSFEFETCDDKLGDTAISESISETFPEDLKEGDSEDLTFWQVSTLHSTIIDRFGINHPDMGEDMAPVSFEKIYQDFCSSVQKALTKEHNQRLKNVNMIYCVMDDYADYSSDTDNGTDTYSVSTDERSSTDENSYPYKIYLPTKSLGSAGESESDCSSFDERDFN